MTPKALKRAAPHGTRARYVGKKCRCEECRAANTAYNRDRENKAIAAAMGVVAEKKPVAQEWTLADGTKKTRFYKRACPGVDEKGCPTDSHLRKDSKGGVCGECRHYLISNPLVPTFEVVEHIQKLRRQGLGDRQIADLVCIDRKQVRDMRRGVRKWVRKQTAKKILDVDISAASDGSYISAAPTWLLIREMRTVALMTDTEITERLGYKNRGIQFRRKITVVNAEKVRKLHKEVMEEVRLGKELEKHALCDSCGLSHAPADRQRVIKRLLPCTTRDILETYPCFYPKKSYGPKTIQGRTFIAYESRMVFRDLNALGAVYDNGSWSLPDGNRSEGQGADSQCVLSQAD